MSAPEPPDPRVTLALERTLLAWTRTALALMGFGFVVARLALFLQEIALAQAFPSSSRGVSRWLGVCMVILGSIVQIVALFHYRSQTRQLERGQPLIPTLWTPAALLGMALAGIGLLLAVYLTALP